MVLFVNVERAIIFDRRFKLQFGHRIDTPVSMAGQCDYTRRQIMFLTDVVKLFCSQVVEKVDCC